jgi:hypothetical protein
MGPGRGASRGSSASRSPASSSQAPSMVTRSPRTPSPVRAFHQVILISAVLVAAGHCRRDRDHEPAANGRSEAMPRRPTRRNTSPGRRHGAGASQRSREGDSGHLKHHRSRASRVRHALHCLSIASLFGRWSADGPGPWRRVTHRPGGSRSSIVRPGASPDHPASTDATSRPADPATKSNHQALAVLEAS